MKLDAYYITEQKDEFCVKCRQRKAGKFLIINLPNNKYTGICGDCL